MIRGSCHTNIDERRHDIWPTAFAALPRKGDKVQSKDCRGGKGYTLEVVQITHYELHGEPRILVELSKPALRV